MARKREVIGPREPSRQVTSLKADVDDGPSTLGGQATGDHGMDPTSRREALRG
ncbi:hypothetical protein [Streptomyces sp. OE57]|uniref:hypothetical protein n=1 Tax=Streptomyces lacaronensis TaxID=3379885 RepID=UPI0039B72F65